MKTNNTIAKATDELNSLLRGELAATETYRQVVENIGEDLGGAELRRIHREHCEAVATLRNQIRRCGGQPEEDSGAWGTFAQAVEGAAKVFGNTTALKALKEGEEQGITDYESALKTGELPTDCKTAIVSTLLPQTRGHVAVLDSLISVNA